MLSSVLNSKRAIEVNIAIMRAFVRLREMLATHKELAHKLSDLEQRLEKHDDHIQTIFEAIRQMMAPSDKKGKKKINNTPILVFFALLSLISLFLTHNRSTFIWKLFPFMPYFQFPWRFLGIALFSLSFISGSLIKLIPNFLQSCDLWVTNRQAVCRCA